MKKEKFLKVKQKLIDQLYNILIQYEKIGEENVTFETYSAYLDTLYTKIVGYGDEEVIRCLRGLTLLGNDASHFTVRRTVFYMIHIINNKEAF